MTWVEWLTHAYNTRSVMELVLGVLVGLPAAILGATFLGGLWGPDRG